MRSAWVGACLVVTGCQTPVSTRSGRLSASEHTGAFASDSGDSSAGSGDSSAGSGNSSEGSNSDSGNSSQGSNDSSGQSGDSSQESAGSTNEESSNQSSEQSTKNSTENTSGSSGESSKNNPVLSATVIGLTVVGLGAVFWQVAERAMRATPQAPPPPQEVARAAQAFLRARTHQLREDLALGAGPTVEELAALARIRREHLGLFGRLLRAHRHELLALADARTLTPERAAEWLRRVGEIARTHPLLEEDRRAFLSLYEGSETRP